MENKNIELIKKLLIQNGCNIHPMTAGVMVYAYRDNRGKRDSSVCSLLAEDLVVSISINGKANLNKSTNLVRCLFGKHFAIEHLKSCPVDGKQANYFGLRLLH
ncbi:hypothetical protein [Gallibacterium sp. ZY190522]